MAWRRMKRKRFGRKKKTFRRRFRRGFRRHKSRVTKMKYRSLYPKDYAIGKTKMRVLYTVDMTALLGSTMQISIPGNYIKYADWDPRVIASFTASETQGPQNWVNLISPFYLKACILGSKCDVRFIQVTNSSGATQNTLWKLALVPLRARLAVPSTGTYEQMVSQPNCKRKYTWNLGTNNHVKISNYIGTSKFMGQNSNKLYLDDTLQGTVQTYGCDTPSKPWYWTFVASTINDLPSQNIQIVEVWMTYYFRAWEKIAQATSSAT